jgi:phospholipid/cholesterol/gamma-HCH transport system substrate-binding protein
MARRKRRVETIVGLFVLASLALLFLIVVFIGRRQYIFAERYEIVGMWKSVGGLQPGAEVLLAGINVGYVKDIKFGPENKVRVTMSISAAQRERIRGDSVASIQTMGLMGDRYIDITVGSAETPVIQEGGVINTAELFELAEVLEAVRPTLRNLENAIKNISFLTDQLADPSGEVGTILDNLKVVTTEVREGRGTIGALLTREDLYVKSSEVLDTAQDTMDNLKEVSENAKEASAHLPDMTADAQEAVRKVSQFSDDAARAAAGFADMAETGKDVMREADEIAANLKQASENINDAARRVGPLLESADKAVNEAQNVLDAAKRSWLLRGSFEPGSPGQPLAVGGRDVAEPEVAQ